MKFKSRKDISFKLFTIISISVLIALETYIFFTETYSFGITDIVILFIIPILLWIYFGTYYKLTASNLEYTSGPMKGSIPVTKIKEIIVGKTMWSGLKPATAKKGLIIKYDTYNEIYITPKARDFFIMRIFEINPDIKITPYDF
jgi:hypothetical protein